MSDQAKTIYSFLYGNTRQMSNWLVAFINLTFKWLSDHSIIVFEDQSRYKKSPYSELFWSVFFPDFPTFGLNTERYEVSLRIQSECGKIRGKFGPE